MTRRSPVSTEAVHAFALKMAAGPDGCTITRLLNSGLCSYTKGMQECRALVAAGLLFESTPRKGYSVHYFDSAERAKAHYTANAKVAPAQEQAQRAVRVAGPVSAKFNRDAAAVNDVPVTQCPPFVANRKTLVDPAHTGEFSALGPGRYLTAEVPA